MTYDCTNAHQLLSFFIRADTENDRDGRDHGDADDGRGHARRARNLHHRIAKTLVDEWVGAHDGAANGDAATPEWIVRGFGRARPYSMVSRQ